MSQKPVKKVIGNTRQRVAIWGETTTKSNYSNSNPPTYGLAYSQLQSQGYIDSEGNLTAQHDAATANWGSDWRMPTTKELKELINNCTWTWTTQNGVNGYTVTGPNGNRIFLPAAGYRIDSSLDRAGSYGDYWSSSLDTDDSDGAWDLGFYLGDVSRYSHYVNVRHYGLPVRAVCE